MLRKKEGYTVTEALIGLSLLLISALGTMKMQALSIQTNSLADGRSTAIILAQDKLEVLKRTPYALVTSDSDTSGLFTRTWTVQNNAPEAGMKTVTVSVSWQDGAKSVRLQTIIVK